MNFPLIISLIIHLLFIIGATLTLKNPFTNKLEDKGYAVFEYKEIGPKSKAPVISQDEGRASKTKAKKNDADATPNAKKTVQSDIDKNTEKMKEISLNDKKKGQKPKKKEEKKKVSDKKNDAKKLDKAVVNLNRNKKSSTKADPNAKKKSFDSVLDDAIAIGDNENEGVKAEELGPVLTATQIDLIRQTIRKCWHFPAGLKNAEELSVEIRMELSKDGSVKSAEIVDKKRLNSDPDFKIAAENAYRAVLDPECSPLPLPREKYDEWKDLELTFNPKDMF